MVERVTEGRTVLAEGFGLTEAPRWRKDRLYFSDIYGHRVHTVDAAGRVETVVAFDGPCSGLGFMPNGDLLVSLMAETKLVRVSDGQIVDHADLSRFADTEINDMIVDPSGRAFVTQLGPPRTSEAAGPRYTRVIVIEPDGTARAGCEGLQGPNGIGLSADGRTLVISEAAACRMSALDVSLDGRLSGLRTIATLPERICPDGMCLDDQGGVWAAGVVEIAQPLKPGPGFCRYDNSGKLTHVIPLEPGRFAVACAFGGPDRGVLFLCTSGAVDPEGALRQRSARIEQIRIPGLAGDGLP